MMKTIDRDAILALLRSDAAIPGLSVRQPYAHHIVFDGKDIENRNWHFRYRGWCFVHAGTQPYDGGAAEKRRLESKGMQFGGIIGAMLIARCVTQSDSAWFNGPYGLVITEAIPLQFMPCRGALGFFQPAIDRTKLALAG